MDPACDTLNLDDPEPGEAEPFDGVDLGTLEQAAMYTYTTSADMPAAITVTHTASAAARRAPANVPTPVTAHAFEAGAPATVAGSAATVVAAAGESTASTAATIAAATAAPIATAATAATTNRQSHIIGRLLPAARGTESRVAAAKEGIDGVVAVSSGGGPGLHAPVTSELSVSSSATAQGILDAG